MTNEWKIKRKEKYKETKINKASKNCEQKLNEQTETNIAV